MKHSEMTRWEIRKYYVTRASQSICDEDMRFYLQHAGFNEVVELKDLELITTNNPLRNIL